MREFLTSIGLCGIEIAYQMYAAEWLAEPQSDCVELKWLHRPGCRQLQRTSIGLCGIEIAAGHRLQKGRSRPQSDCVELKFGHAKGKGAAHHDLNRTVWN